MRTPDRQHPEGTRPRESGRGDSGDHRQGAEGTRLEDRGPSVWPLSTSPRCKKLRNWRARMAEPQTELGEVRVCCPTSPGAQSPRRTWRTTTASRPTHRPPSSRVSPPSSPFHSGPVRAGLERSTCTAQHTGPPNPQRWLQRHLANGAAVYLINAKAREDAAVRAEEMQQMATRDTLTGLPNRVLLRQRLEHTAQRAC